MTHLTDDEKIKLLSACLFLSPDELKRMQAQSARAIALINEWVPPGQLRSNAVLVLTELRERTVNGSKLAELLHIKDTAQRPCSINAEKKS